MATKQEQLQALFHRYQLDHGGVPETPYEVIKWALTRGLIDPPGIDPAEALADQMARALREEYATDPVSGRRYRRNHAVTSTTNGVQGSLWAEMDRAPHGHMVKAFQQRRKQIIGDCVQLKTDADVYNGRHPAAQSFQLVLDFTNDVAEAEAADAAAWCGVFLHRAAAATRAISWRSAFVSAFARARPPLDPPRRLAVVAYALWLVGSVTGSPECPVA